MRKLIVLIMLIVFSGIQANADVIHLKDGTKIVGLIIEESDSDVRIRTSSGIKSFNWSAIEDIKTDTNTSTITRANHNSGAQVQEAMPEIRLFKAYDHGSSVFLTWDIYPKNVGKITIMKEKQVIGIAEPGAVAFTDLSRPNVRLTQYTIKAENGNMSASENTYLIIEKSEAQKRKEKAQARVDWWEHQFKIIGIITLITIVSGMIFGF